MGVLVVTCLAAMILLFLATLAVQAIRLEKSLADLAAYAEEQLGHVYRER